MPPMKRRVNLYLDKETYRQAQQMVKRVPGASVSDLVNELLQEAIPMVNAFLDEAEKGATFVDDEVAQEKLFTQLLASRAVELMMGNIQSIHKVFEKAGEKREAA